MSEEIKEINRIIQSISDFYKMDNALKYYLDRRKANILLNYITNLQQKVEQLEKENEQLRTQVNAYENPDDLTLFYMWLDEKAKDKIKQLEERCTYLERSNNRREDEIIELRDENVDLVSKNKQLEKENRQLCDVRYSLDRVQLEKRIEQLENIIDVKKYDYDYLETLFSKSSKEEVLKAYTYKCEQLEKVMEARNEFEMKSMQLENIIKEATEYIKNDSYFDGSGMCATDLLNTLNKGSDKE